MIPTRIFSIQKGSGPVRSGAFFFHPGARATTNCLQPNRYGHEKPPRLVRSLGVKEIATTQVS